jgi:hypothetical protein
VESVSIKGDELLTPHDDGSVHMQDCEVCGDTREVLALVRTRATRDLTAEERKAFGVRSCTAEFIFPGFRFGQTIDRSPTISFETGASDITS